jgi:hypothetical protein
MDLAFSVQAFDRVNVLMSHIPEFGPAVHGVQGPPIRHRQLGRGPDGGPYLSVAVLGNSLLIADSQRNRVLRLRKGVISVFAGTGEAEPRIDPDSPLRTSLPGPSNLLALRDGSVLVACLTGVVRIRTRARQGRAIVSRFVGTGKPVRASDSGSDPRMVLWQVTAMAEERDGSVLIADALGPRVFRVHPDRTVDVFAGRGIPGALIDPGPGSLGQLRTAGGLAVMKDDSVLVLDTQRNRVLRIREGRVTVFAGQDPGAEHPMALAWPITVTTLPDQSVWLLDGDPLGYARIQRITEQGVSQLVGPEADGPGIDPVHGFPGLGIRLPNAGSIWAALRDGSVVLASAPQGLLLLSPADALQARLEALVNRGKAAVRAQDLADYRQAELELAYLCEPGKRAMGAVNHAAHQSNRLEPSDLAPGLHLHADLMGIVSGYADNNDAERLRAQLALKELRKFKKERLGRRDGRL